jgi:hypothetical protein
MTKAVTASLAVGSGDLQEKLAVADIQLDGEAVRELATF